MSIHKLRRQLTALNKRLKWYDAHFEVFPSTRKRRGAHRRLLMERDNVKWQIALLRAVHPSPLEERCEQDGLAWLEGSSEGLRRFYMPRFDIRGRRIV